MTYSVDWGEIESTPLPPRHPKKEFKPYNPVIEILEDYSKAPKKELCRKFPRNKNVRGRTPYKIKVEKLEELVAQAGETEQLVTLLEEGMDTSQLLVRMPCQL